MPPAAEDVTMAFGFLKLNRSRAADDRLGAIVTANPAPVQVCPRGCYWERARRQSKSRTRFSGWADIQIDFDFESRNCPHCGSLLVQKCQRCNGAILLSGRDGRDPDDRCRTCGLPYPWSSERTATVVRVRPSERSLRDENGYAKCVDSDSARGDLWLVADSIANLTVSAIVSGDDVDGHMWTDAASEIKEAAGEDVQRQAIDTAPLTQGIAWVTDAGALHFDEIVHVAAMDRGGETRLDVALRCIRNALELAYQKDLESLAVPVLGWGPRDITLSAWLTAITDEVVSFLHEPSPSQGTPLSILLAVPFLRDFDARAARVEELVRTKLSAGPHPPTHQGE